MLCTFAIRDDNSKKMCFNRDATHTSCIMFANKRQRQKWYDNKLLQLPQVVCIWLTVALNVLSVTLTLIPPPHKSITLLLLLSYYSLHIFLFSLFAYLSNSLSDCQFNFYVSYHLMSRSIWKISTN